MRLGLDQILGKILYFDSGEKLGQATQRNYDSLIPESVQGHD